MGKTPKQELGQHVPSDEISLVNLISEAITTQSAPAAAQLEAIRLPASGNGAESSAVEEEAAMKGAGLLFSKRKVGCISALGIVLIPEENKQNRRIAAVSEPFGFVAHLSKRHWIAVVTPKGYVTDFASIPAIVRWLISPFGKHAEAAVVHDWLYTIGTKGDGRRKMADLTFKRAMKEIGVNIVIRNVMYFAVSIGGGGGYGLESDFDFRAVPDVTPLKEKPEIGQLRKSTWYLKRWPKKRKQRDAEQKDWLPLPKEKKRR